MNLNLLSIASRIFNDEQTLIEIVTISIQHNFISTRFNQNWMCVLVENFL